MVKQVLNTVSFLVFTVILSSCNGTVEKVTFGDNLFNKNWEFVKDVNQSIAVLSDDGNKDVVWEAISIPHTANIEPLVIKGKQWQGVCYYRKSFKVPKKYKNNTIALYFEGAMQVAEVYLNNELLYINKGGYLPFYVSLSDQLKFGENNTLLIKLNNEDNQEVPPGKAIDELDFNIYSGIYRNVWLQVKNPVHITNVLEVDRIAGGGVFVNSSNISKTSSNVNIRAEVINTSLVSRKVYIMAGLTNDENEKKNSSDVITLAPNESTVLTTSINIKDPKLWSVNNPYLYHGTVKLFSDEAEVDNQKIRVGIRDIEITAEDGVKINGQSVKVRGTNRHQEYPYIGYALSDNANYRDAYKIKQAGFNMVRLSHYPQSQSFLNACDELGILVMDAIPGWQYFGNENFQHNSLNDIRKMIRVDRNHPSVFLWESSLNESQMSEDFMKEAHQVVHEEYPGKYVYSCGWKEGVYDVFIPARQHAKAPLYWNNYTTDKPLFIAEYGDWEYYAQNAGFNQKEYGDLSDEERNSRQLRGDGQKRLAQQALNYQEAHNSNLQGSAIGDANWLMFDYNRGYAPDIEASGVMDIFRLPKFAYCFYQSQTDIHAANQFAKPMISISNYYNDPSFLKVKVYSNCDEVELLVNGKSYAKQKPDTDVNSSHIFHPPFTFQLKAFIPGVLEARGYIKGKLIVSTKQKTPGEAYSIKLWIDESGKNLERSCNDVVFLHAAIVDKDGTVLPLAQNRIQFSVRGDGCLIGNNPINAEAGIASILLKAGEKANILQVSAEAEGLKQGELIVNVQ
nr:glycoside hydrolase family 2 TIM barrel-domain containing protein [uncultured Carboxylicivirga sp.]